MLQKCDAAILIGDRALQVSPEEYHVTDLAREWIGWQHRPFVFAFWACRSHWSPPADLTALFEQAKAYGLAARPQIAANYARTLDLPEQFLRQYLYNNVDYGLDASHIEGLERFYRLAREHGLTTNVRPVRFLASAVPSDSSESCVSRTS
jgi:chorismate dehydratase